MRLLVNSTNPTGKTHSATVIFFHGSGDTGFNLIEWVRFLLGKDMDFPHIKIIYPTAPKQSYTPIDGQMSNVWFDRRALSIEVQENRKSMSEIYKTVHELIKNEIQIGIPTSRIIVGGFSMGGALALHTGYHLNTDLAGVFACSSFLNRGSIVYESLRNRTDVSSSLPELRMFHGESDSLVPINWGQETFEQLTKLGILGHFTQLSKTLHELKKSELLDIQEWLLKKLPPLQEDVLHKL